MRKNDKLGETCDFMNETKNPTLRKRQKMLTTFQKKHCNSLETLQPRHFNQAEDETLRKAETKGARPSDH